jgi:hypothetical protein
MAKVFMWYRRSLSAGAANRLAGTLAALEGPGSVFIDAHQIGPGEDIPKRIRGVIDD